MNLDVTRDDINFLRRVSEAGERAPLIGGRYLLLWGTLVSVAYIFQYAILSGVAGLPPWSLLIVWAVVMLIAGPAMWLFNRQIKSKPGIGSVGNRTEQSVWMAVGWAVFAYAMGTIGAVMFNGASPILFDLIIAVAFAGYGAAFYVVSSMAKANWLKWPSIGAFIGTASVPFMAGDPIVYMFSAGMIFFIAIVPGIISLRLEAQPLPHAATNTDHEENL